MTVAEVSKALAALDQDAECIVHVRTHTQKCSVAQVSPFLIDYMGIWISLPSNMHTVERKERNT